MKKFVCHIKDLKDHHSYGYQIALEDGELDILVIRQGKDVRIWESH